MVKLEDMSEEHLSDESPERKYSSKRNRISFVCQACRKSKTKCDREKPRCSRCSKINIKCVYDIEKQRAPRVPSKDATIKRLSQELEYWKKKASRYMEMEETGLFPPHKKGKTNQECGVHGKVSIEDEGRSDDESLSQDTLLSVSGKQVPAPEDIAVNFYEHCPQLLVKDTMKRDIKPSCELSQIRQDKFLAIFISSVFASASKNALIHSIPSDDVSPHLDRAKQKQNAVTLRNTMFRLANSDRDREHIIQFTDRIIEGNTMAGSRAGFYIRMFTHTQYRNYIEDFCPRGAKYSEVLKDLIVKVEMFLPPLRIVKKYLVHFYKFVYPVIPFLDVGLFESVLAELLKEDPIGNGRAKLNLGYDKIRSKIENIAILLIVLKLSNISMGFSQPAPDKGTLSPDIKECLTNYPISDEAITLSQTAIVSVNLFNWTNENSIACLLYLWAFFVFGPQEGDFGLGQPTEVILSLVNSMAINIGLHRDPSTYEQLNDPTVSDPRIRNYRRKLWICIFVVCRYETSLRGKYPQAMRDHTASFLNADFPQQYMESVLADMPQRDPYAIMIHSLTFKRYQLLLMITELDEISIHSNIRIPLARIEALLDNIWQFLESEVPSDLSNFSDESELIPLNLECSGSNEFVDIIKIKKLVFFQTFMIKKLTILRTVINLMLYFEKMTFDGREYMVYFQKYFVLTVKETVQFTNLLLQHLNSTVDDPYLFFMKYKLDKIAQLSASSVLFSLLSIILRMVHSEYLLQKALQNGDMIGVEDVYVTKQKIELISSIKDNTIDTLEILCTVVTKKLGFTYFSVFQMLIFFDYCNQIIKKREVLNIFSRITQLTYHPKVRKRVYEGFGIDVDKKDTILQFLNDSTFIKLSNLQELQLLKEFSMKVPRSFLDIVPPDNTMDVKNCILSSPTPIDHAGCSDTSNLPFPVISENSPAFVVVQNAAENSQAFTGEFQHFPTAQLDPLISFEDLDLLDYEFLFGSTG